MIRIAIILTLLFQSCTPLARHSPPQNAIQHSVDAFPWPSTEDAFSQRVRTQVKQEILYDDPFSMSVMKTANLTAPPTLSGVSFHLEKKIYSRQVRYDLPLGDDRIRIQRDMDNEKHIRLTISGVRGEIIPGRKYWELIYINILLIPLGEESLADKIISSSKGGNRYANTPLGREITKPRTIFELSVIVSGRYTAGGYPNDLRGYANDYQASGFGEDLDSYASRTIADITQYLRSRISESFDQDLGTKLIKGASNE